MISVLRYASVTRALLSITGLCYRVLLGAVAEPPVALRKVESQSSMEETREWLLRFTQLACGDPRKRDLPAPAHSPLRDASVTRALLSITGLFYRALLRDDAEACICQQLSLERHASVSSSHLRVAGLFHRALLERIQGSFCMHTGLFWNAYLTRFCLAARPSLSNARTLRASGSRP